MKFGRSLFGYSRPAVDGYVAEQEAIQARRREEQEAQRHYVAEQTEVRRTLEAEIQRLRAAEPMLKVNDEVSALLLSFASTVSTMREQAEREATHTRAEADGYARGRRDEAERLFNQEVARASDVADRTIRAARNEALTLAQSQAAVEQALRDLAAGASTWLATLERLRATPQLAVHPGSDTPADDAGAAPEERPTPPSPSDVGRSSPSGAEGEPAGPPPLSPVELDREHGRIVDFRPISRDDGDDP